MPKDKLASICYVLSKYNRVHACELRRQRWLTPGWDGEVGNTSALKTDCVKKVEEFELQLAPTEARVFERFRLSLSQLLRIIFTCSGAWWLRFRLSKYCSTNACDVRIFICAYDEHLLYLTIRRWKIKKLLRNT
jgi:hypothetical protein